MNLLTSTLDIFCLGRTSLLISCDEYHMRCYGSLMGPVGRAICEYRLVIVSLEGTHKVQQPALIRLRRQTFDLVYVVSGLLHNNLCFPSI